MNKHLSLLLLFLAGVPALMGSTRPTDLPREDATAANTEKAVWVILSGKARINREWAPFVLTTAVLRDNTTRPVRLYQAADKEGYTQDDYEVIWLAYHAGRLWIDCGEGAFDMRKELSIEESFKWTNGVLYQFTVGDAALVRDLEIYVKLLESRG